MKRVLSLFTLLALALTMFAQTQKKEYKVSGYDGFNASGIFEIELIKGSNEGVIIETEDVQLFEFIKVNVSGNTLNLNYDTSKVPSNLKDKKGKPIKVTVYIKDLVSLNLSGASRLFTNSSFSPEKFEAKISGATSVKGLEINSQSARIVLSGASSITINGNIKTASYEISGASRANINQEIGGLKLSGSGASKIEFNGLFEFAELSLSGAVNLKLLGSGAKRVELEASGACNFDSFDFPVEEMDIELSGVSNAKVFVTKTIGARSNGGSNIAYKGDPQIKSVDISSVSSFKKIN
ncbi:MAG: hypothetical protein CVU10_00685 [Bacteroidetes bacterium HGW-Bacteroidetes-5]|jgi:hypothetical protein|nr:MAG: hypothetical protein CVU10_00685 [Bacteroidetes bacterium HGW-Bacteroidetes-5]